MIDEHVSAAGVKQESEAAQSRLIYYYYYCCDPYHVCTSVETRYRIPSDVSTTEEIEEIETAV